jgi:hypothetical protein
MDQIVVETAIEEEETSDGAILVAEDCSTTGATLVDEAEEAIPRIAA